MLAPIDRFEPTRQRLTRALQQLPLTMPEGFVSISLELPVRPQLAPLVAAPQFQFMRHSTGSIVAGYGIAGEWPTSGTTRFDDLRRAAFTLRDRWHRQDIDRTGLDGIAMVGFAASPYFGNTETELPNALLWLPEVALHCVKARCAVIFTTALPACRSELAQRWQAWLDWLQPALAQPSPRLVSPTQLIRTRTNPDHAQWQMLVHSALRDIAAAQLDKVVLSRCMRLTGQRDFDLARLLRALTGSFPTCQVIHLQRAHTHFVAATPERLLAQSHRQIEVDAIAGTVARSPQVERDAALTAALQSSAKDLHEHRLVIDAIRDALQPHAVQIEVPSYPKVMQLNNAQHLWSPVQATLKPNIDLFTLAAALHPTPATNGQPRHAASTWLKRNEPFERGWFTGAAGILRPDMTGELWVLLRCAEIAGNQADLYAGAGIVLGSDPHAEWFETEDKLAAMSTALRFA